MPSVMCAHTNDSSNSRLSRPSSVFPIHFSGQTLDHPSIGGHPNGAGATAPPPQTYKLFLMIPWDVAT